MDKNALFIVFISIIGGIVRVSTPYLFVSLGELITEKSGRINLGLEGILVMGGMTGYGISYLTGSPFLGIIAAGVSGLLLGSIHGWLCKYKSVNSIALGIALMTLGIGLSFFLGKGLIKPEAPQLGALHLGDWSSIPSLREALQINYLFITGILLVPVIGYVLKNTRWGMILRMVGESSSAAKSQGYNIDRVRLCATMIGGFLAGVGGSFLTLYYPGSWTEGLSSGQGLMAVSLVIFSNWNPVKCLWASLLFGAVGSMGVAFQSIGFSGGYHLFSMAPALLTLIIMTIASSPNHNLRGRPAELSINS